MTRSNGGIGCSSIFLLVPIALAAYWYGQRETLPEPAPVAQEEFANGQTVVVAVKQLARLETVTFHMERIIDLKDRQSRFFGLLQSDDALLLVAAGDVIAGVDLAALTTTDITLDEAGSHVTLSVPAPTILVSRLDNKRTYVYRRKTDLLAERADALETRARQLAETEIEQAALAAGILEHARKGADATLRALVHSLGFREVEVRFKKPPQ